MTNSYKIEELVVGEGVIFIRNYKKKFEDEEKFIYEVTLNLKS